MLDFVLYTCSYGLVADQTVLSVERLRHTDFRFEWWFQTGDALISRSRSIAAYQFLKKNRSPYLIFLDGDIIFTPKDIEKMLNALQVGHDVVGGLYPVRGGTFLAQRGWKGQFRISGELEEVQFVSTGFLGISRRILEKITEDMPILNKGSWSECYPVFEDGKYEDIFISEDWDFCNKARKAGAVIYAHTGIQLQHLKEKVYTTQEAIENMKQVPEDSNNLKELAEYLGVKDMPSYAEVLEELRQRWANWSGMAEDFYRDPEVGQVYLYDLAYFNAGEHYSKRWAAVRNGEHLHILEIGCGIGTVLLELSLQNKNLVGYDLNEKALEFARYRAANKGARNVIFTSTWPQDLGKFDLIIAIDTLEHIEDLRGFLLKLGKGMKKGARFYHHDCFWEHETSPMHFDHSEHIDEWLEEAGLVKFDEHWCVKG